MRLAYGRDPRPAPAGGLYGYEQQQRLFLRGQVQRPPAALGYGCPLIAAVAAVLAGLLWRAGVRHYRSTGS